MSEQKPSLLIPPNGGQIPSEESKLSEEYFAKVVGTLIELVQTRKDNESHQQKLFLNKNNTSINSLFLYKNEFFGRE
jgi:hypothetical protein